MKRTIAYTALCAALSVCLLSGAEPTATVPPAPAPEPKAGLLDKLASSYVKDDLPSWLDLSGEFRFRFESRQGNGFREGNDDGYGLFRTRVDIGIRAKPWLQFHFQGQDSRAPGHKNANAVSRDPFDVRQVYVKIGGGEASPFAVTAGRQLLNYGDQRLIGPLDWTNTSRTWDAVKLELQATKDAKLDFFSSSVVQNDPSRRINHHQDGVNLHGFYGTLKGIVPKSTLEPFALWQTSPVVLNELHFRGDLDRYTGGFRLWSKSLGPVDYNFALVQQWGDVAGADIRSWGYYAELGYTVAAAPWKPRLYAEYTFGSGDSDPTDGKVGGFNDIYPTAHLWYGYNDLVGWRNLKNVRIGADLKPYREIGLKLDYHSFWLANRNDGLYNVGGVRTVAAPSCGARDTKIGDEADATFTLPLTKILTVGGGVGYMFPGPFLKQNTSGDRNVFSFLFIGYRF